MRAALQRCCGRARPRLCGEASSSAHHSPLPCCPELDLSRPRRAKRDEEAAGGAQPEAAAASSSADTAPAAADSANAAAASSSPTAASKAAAKAKEAAESLALLGPPPSHAELTALITQIVPFHMAHNAEVEVRAARWCSELEEGVESQGGRATSSAQSLTSLPSPSSTALHLTATAPLQAVDLLLETESLELLAAHGAVDAASFPRVCLYLLKCAGAWPRCGVGTWGTR